MRNFTKLLWIVAIALTACQGTPSLTHEARKLLSLNGIRTGLGQYTATYSRDGHTILTFTGIGGDPLGTGVAQVWDANTGQELFQISELGVLRYAVYSPPDGRTILAIEYGVENGKTTGIIARLWDASTGKVLSQLPHKMPVGLASLLAYRPDGQALAVASSNTIMIMNVADQKLEGITIKGEGDLDVDLNPTIALLDQTEWSRNSVSPRYEIRFIASASVLDVKTCSYVLPNGGEAGSFDITHKGAKVRVTITDLQRSQEIAHNSFTGELDYSDCPATVQGPTNDELAVAKLDHKAIKAWIEAVLDGQPDLISSNDSIITFKDVDPSSTIPPIRNLRYSPDGRYIALIKDLDWSKHSLAIWDTTQNKEIHQFEVRNCTDSTTSLIDYSSDSRTILFGFGADCREVFTYDIETGKQLVNLIGHSDVISSVRFSPNGRTILTASHDKTARLWNATTGNELFKIITARSLDHADYSPDGHRIVTSGSDGIIEIWDISSLTGE